MGSFQAIHLSKIWKDPPPFGRDGMKSALPYSNPQKYRLQFSRWRRHIAASFSLTGAGPPASSSLLRTILSSFLRIAIVLFMPHPIEDHRKYGPDDCNHPAD